eukprot:scaffold243620_cov22-Tisochrysis_lutea.AAC.1
MSNANAFCVGEVYVRRMFTIGERGGRWGHQGSQRGGQAALGLEGGWAPAGTPPVPTWGAERPNSSPRAAQSATMKATLGDSGTKGNEKRRET